jgi:hypothetical protein
MKKKENKQNDESKKISIYDCLDLFTKDEILEDIVCENCKEKQIFTKNLKIERIPKYLVLSLKRFKITMMKNSKINCPIKFPLKNINLDKYLVNNSQENSKVYDLFAVINHNGSLSGGHYNCIIKQNNRWIKYNDSSVSYLSRTFDTEEAYILVYKFVENKKYNNYNFNYMGLMDTAYKIYIKQLKFEHIFNYLIDKEGEIIEEYKDNCEFYYGEPVTVNGKNGFIVNVTKKTENEVIIKIKLKKGFFTVCTNINNIEREILKKRVDINLNLLINYGRDKQQKNDNSIRKTTTDRDIICGSQVCTIY